MTHRLAHRADGQPADVDCGSCGRFVGPETVCPYCGAESERRGSQRLLRLVSALLAVGGLAALAWHARVSPVPLVRAGDIAPAMAQASIRIAGTAATAARVIEAEGHADYVSFDVDDGSGRLTVAASRRVARQLAATQGALPQRGDRVEVVGRLSLAADRKPRLYLSDSAGLRVIAAGEAPAP